MAHGVVKQHHLRDIPHIDDCVKVGLPVCTVCNKTWLYTTFQNHDIMSCYVGFTPVKHYWPILSDPQSHIVTETHSHYSDR